MDMGVRYPPEAGILAKNHSGISCAPCEDCRNFLHDILPSFDLYKMPGIYRGDGAFDKRGDDFHA